ncbi:hypothetical protein V492_08188 [Pseudogymnoascus sp. VKM F-4246]|nr:hypothetical protein V492_08188 [Pseudogymnoascus sp. VKM F-4246]
MQRRTSTTSIGFIVPYPESAEVERAEKEPKCPATYCKQAAISGGIDSALYEYSSQRTEGLLNLTGAPAGAPAAVPAGAPAAVPANSSQSVTFSPP